MKLIARRMRCFVGPLTDLPESAFVSATCVIGRPERGLPTSFLSPSFAVPASAAFLPWRWPSLMARSARWRVSSLCETARRRFAFSLLVSRKDESLFVSALGFRPEF